MCHKDLSEVPFCSLCKWWLSRSQKSAEKYMFLEKRMYQTISLSIQSFISGASRVLDRAKWSYFVGTAERKKKSYVPLKNVVYCTMLVTILWQDSHFSYLYMTNCIDYIKDRLLCLPPIVKTGPNYCRSLKYVLHVEFNHPFTLILHVLERMMAVEYP